MADLNLVVGQVATGTLTFSESGAPADGAVAGDNDAVATISLDADHATWHITAVSAPDPMTNVVTFTYKGTSDPPDVGPVVVPPMTANITPVPVAETGNFNPSGATITGP